MDASEHWKRLEAMYRAAPINAAFPSKIEVGEGWARIEMTVAERYFHAAGAAHGAAYFKMMDDAGFYAVSSKVTDVFMLTTGFNLHLTRPIESGRMIAEAHWLHGHRRVFLAEAVLKDGAGEEIARGSGNFMKSRIPLADIDAYKNGA